MESNHIAHELLARAHPPERAATIFKEKVLYRPLLIRPSSPDLASQDARAIRRLKRVRAEEKSRKNRTPKPLSAKQKRILGVYDIPKEQQKYELYVPLNKMWIGYMQEILDMKQGGSFVKTQFVGPKLASADFHGAEIEVVRCRDVGRVGCKGIVIKDTKFTFEVVTRADKLIGMFRQYLRRYAYILIYNSRSEKIYSFSIQYSSASTRGLENYIYGSLGTGRINSSHR